MILSTRCVDTRGRGGGRRGSECTANRVRISVLYSGPSRSQLALAKRLPDARPPRAQRGNTQSPRNTFHGIYLEGHFEVSATSLSGEVLTACPSPFRDTSLYTTFEFNPRCPTRTIEGAGVSLSREHVCRRARRARAFPSPLTRTVRFLRPRHALHRIQMPGRGSPNCSQLVNIWPVSA